MKNVFFRRPFLSLINKFINKEMTKLEKKNKKKKKTRETLESTDKEGF